MKIKYALSGLAIALLMVSCGGRRSIKSPDAAGTEKFIVASQMVDCVGVGLQKCLVVKQDHEYDWEIFYSWIEGFDYEPGYEYVISVYKEAVHMPPADASSVRYILDRIISRQEKQSVGLPDTSHLREGMREMEQELDQ